MKGIQLTLNNLQQAFENGNSLRLEGYRGRYAPSPTGSLHIGNLRTALVSWLRARSEAGSWLLRIDDLDRHRNRLGSVEEIIQDLGWLGLTWDGPIIYQSQREELYNLVLSRLLNNGMLFSCKCSRKLLREMNQVNNSNYIYPGTCRNLNLSTYYSTDKQMSLRLKVNKEFSGICGDIIVKRADGFVAYNFATAVDDLLLGITEIVRGNDLANGKFSQLAIINSLDQSAPIYRHLPIFLNNQGGKISKRNGGIGLNYLKEKGMTPSMAIGWLASSLGLVPLNSELSCFELLRDLKIRNIKIERLFTGNFPDQAAIF